MLGHWGTEVSLHRPEGPSYRGLVIATGTFACLIGLIDFALFELWGHFSRVLDYVFYKPAFLSFSSLLIHLTFVVWIAFIFVGVFILLRVILRRLTSKSMDFVPLVPLSVALAGFTLLSLRLLKDSDSISGIVALVTSIVLLSVISLAVERCLARSSPQENRKTLAPKTVMLVVGLTLFAFAFFAPDLYALVRGWRHDGARLPKQRPNVMLIVLDTVRADHLSCYGSKTVATPNIDRLAREGLLFLNAFSTAPWTVPSHASMFTGLYTFQHQATWDNTYLRDEFVTLAERLTDAGYATAGFSENPFVGVGNGFAQGFSEFHETWRRPILERGLARILRALGRRDGLEYAPRTTSLLLAWLDVNRSNGRPFFAFVNLMAAHLPSYPRPGYGSTDWPDHVLARIEPVNIVPERYYLPEYRLNETELRVMVDTYNAEISYLDDHIGRIIGSLGKLGALNNTILIVTSDHGENFGEHGFIEHQFCLYNSLIHIPLILRFPQGIESAIIHERVSNIAIMDTILDLANIPTRVMSQRNQQIPLNRIEQDQTIISEYPNAVEMLRDVIADESPDSDYAQFDRDLRCIILGDYKYIWSSTGDHELYSIQHDFVEETNLLQSHQDAARELSEALDQWRQTQQSHPPPSVAPDVDAATRDALKALGYEQ